MVFDIVKLGYDRCNHNLKGFVMSTEDNKEQRHKARQQKVKEQVDARVAAAQEVKGHPLY